MRTSRDAFWDKTRVSSRTRDFLISITPYIFRQIIFFICINNILFNTFNLLFIDSLSFFLDVCQILGCCYCGISNSIFTGKVVVSSPLDRRETEALRREKTTGQRK